MRHALSPPERCFVAGCLLDEAISLGLRKKLPHLQANSGGLSIEPLGAGWRQGVFLTTAYPAQRDSELHRFSGAQ